MRKVGVSDSPASVYLEEQIEVFQSQLDSHKLRFNEVVSTQGEEAALRDWSAERIAQYGEVLRVLKSAQKRGGDYASFLRGTAINAAEILRDFETPRWKYLAFSMILQTLAECSAMESVSS